MNVRGVQKCLIIRIKHWSRDMSLIILPCHIVLGFTDSGLSFFKSKVYLLCEFQDDFQLRLLLMRFKLHS